MIKKLLLLNCFISMTAGYNAIAQETKRHLPIIDVHVHAMKVNPAFAADMCPWFFE